MQVSALPEIKGNQSSASSSQIDMLWLLGTGAVLTLYQPMTHIRVMSSHKPIRIYMECLILGVNTLYRLFCFSKLFAMVGKGLTTELHPGNVHHPPHGVWLDDHNRAIHTLKDFVCFHNIQALTSVIRSITGGASILSTIRSITGGIRSITGGASILSMIRSITGGASILSTIRSVTGQIRSITGGASILSTITGGASIPH